MPNDPPLASTIQPLDPRVPAHARLPIVGHFEAKISDYETARIARIAARMLGDEPALSDIAVFGDGVAAGFDDTCSVLFEDHAEIALARAPSENPLQYRALLLAADGDTVLIPGTRNEAFEEYCRNVLRLGAVNVVGIAPNRPGSRMALAQRTQTDSAALGAICAIARHNGRLNIVPYLGTGSAWRLAGRIAAQTGVRIRVAASPPRLTRRANDKLWFARCAHELLGSNALPPSYHAYGPAALTGRIAFLARRFERVVIKVPDSAGSAGNLVLRSATLRSLPVRALRLTLLRALRNLGWRASYPLMVGLWHCEVLASPSAQFWIPLAADGPPILEGLFDQFVEGDAGEFVGARASALPDRWRERTALEACRLAFLFQRLGYFGRCSFDAVITGAGFDTAQLHWIECNGRWGGTSIPMTLANRLLGDWSRRSLMIVQRALAPHAGCDLASALERLDPVLFRSGRTETGIIVLTPAGIEKGTGLHFMLIADDEQELAELAEHLARMFV